MATRVASIHCHKFCYIPDHNRKFKQLLHVSWSIGQYPRKPYRVELPAWLDNPHVATVK